MRTRLAGILLALSLAVPLAAADRVAAAFGGDIELTPLLHASLQLKHAGIVVQVDPWSVADLSRAEAADLILITDDPVHHLDVKAIQKLRKPKAPVVMPASGKKSIPDGTVLENGASGTFAGVRVESIAAYDLTPGAPEHPKGTANGYVVTLGGRRIYIAGVTECVPEMLALPRVDVAIMPMNIPPARMAPRVTADCVKKLRPSIVYVNHYDQPRAAWLTNPATAARPDAAAERAIQQTLDEFRKAMAGDKIEVRLAPWY